MMKELENIEEKLNAGVDHFTANEVVFLLNQVIILGDLLKREKESKQKYDDKINANMGKDLYKRAHLTVIQGGLQ